MDLKNFGVTYSLKLAETHQDLKARLHRFLIECIEDDRVPIAEWTHDAQTNYIQEKISGYIASQHLAVNWEDLCGLVKEMLDELTGYGPLHGLLQDDKVSDILVNGARNIFIERDGKLRKTGLRFIDDNHVLRVIQRILAPLGRRLDETNPMVDARLPDGSRVNAIVHPLALDGPCLSIRKFRKDPFVASDLLAAGTLSEEMLDFLRLAVEVRCNILVSGSTGAGKTTLLNVLSRYIEETQRLVTIEDAAELQLGHTHVVRLETRPPNAEGHGEVTARELVRNVLRMRPDRIILGEIRGEEVLDLMQAMNTGHDGSLSTIHANSAKDSLTRLEMLAGLAGFQGGENTLRQMIATALDIVVHVSRLRNGQRKIIEIQEVIGAQDGHYVLQELYSYDMTEERFVSNNLKSRSTKFRSAEGRLENIATHWNGRV